MAGGCRLKQKQPLWTRAQDSTLRQGFTAQGMERGVSIRPTREFCFQPALRVDQEQAVREHARVLARDRNECSTTVALIGEELDVRDAPLDGQRGQIAQATLSKINEEGEEEETCAIKAESQISVCPQLCLSVENAANASSPCMVEEPVAFCS